MPSNVDGDLGYGSVSAGVTPGFLSSMGAGSETVRLLVPESEQEPDQWKPLNKEELEVQGGTPGWRKVRSRLLLLFWLGWFGMVGAAVAILMSSPRPVATPRLWWQKALFYRLQPAATGGSAEGPGDIGVVCDHLSDLPTLGVGALILEGLFSKDTSDLMVIDNRAGTMVQLEHLLVESNKAGLKVVFDMCELELPGTTSPAGGDSERSVDPTASVQDGLRYWLERGVAGFGICDTDAAYSEKTLLEWRVVIEEFSKDDDERIVLVKQTGESLPTLDSTINGTLVDLVIVSILPEKNRLLSAEEVAVSVETHLQRPQGALWPCWTLGGEAVVGLQGILLVLITTLPGSSVIQYGQDILPSQNEAEGDKDGREEMGEQQERASSSLIGSLSDSRATEEALLYGSFTFLPFSTTSPSPTYSFSNSTNTTSSSVPVLAFLRSWGCVHFLVVLNLSPEPRLLDPVWLTNLPDWGVFITSTGTGTNRLGSVDLGELTIQPLEAIVLKLFESGSYS